MSTLTFAEVAKQQEVLLRDRPLMRVVNYHNTPRSEAADLEQGLQRYSKDFTSVSEDDLRGYLETGEWHKPKPGLIPVVYEGYRNGYDVMAPLLEKYGFIGWYFIITEFIKGAVPDQITYAKGHHIGMQTREYPNGRYALTWEEIGELSKKHVIANHARNHAELSGLSEEARRAEIFGSQEDFRKNLGHPARTFASLRGPAQNEHPEVDTAKLVVEAGFEFVFSNYRIQRVGSGAPNAT
ncbi:polysaccharide deacetylase family protein [Terriglobus sp.]|uniref:polysaccharide deacetylase family protein n=1 Tax=Terriglobus sp. TaxID=1889013 RepID=UPI003AFFFE08